MNIFKKFFILLTPIIIIFILYLFWAIYANLLNNMPKLLDNIIVHILVFMPYILAIVFIKLVYSKLENNIMLPFLSFFITGIVLVLLDIFGIINAMNSLWIYIYLIFFIIPFIIVSAIVTIIKKILNRKDRNGCLVKNKISKRRIFYE